MSTGYKITDQESVYFCTFTIVQWANISTRKVYRDIVVDSFNYCIKAKGLRVHAYVFMSNHIHYFVGSLAIFPALFAI
jgi:REP element-mobilizing transposase RayT